MTLEEHELYELTKPSFIQNVNFSTEAKHRDPIEPLVQGRNGIPQEKDTPVEETRVVCVYNVTTTEDYIRLLRTEDEACTFDPIDMYEIFSEMEIDGILQPELVDVYQFDTLGEHTIKYTLNEDITDFETAFAENYNLVSIIIPEGVNSINDNAFYECTGLTSVTIPNSVTSIGKWAFFSCSGLTSVTIPNSVTSIGTEAFEDCTGLTSVTIPSSVTNIGDNVFGNCILTSISVEEGNINYDSRNNCNAVIETNTNILIAGCKNTVIPNSVTSIGDYAFYYCSGLTSVTIPNSVTSIGSNAFSICSGLTSVTIPNSVTHIDSNAFQYCNNLTSVNIGNSVVRIGAEAFDTCRQLISVVVEATNPPILNFDVFNNNAQNRKIYVPSGSVNDYKAANGWNDYANDIEAIS